MRCYCCLCREGGGGGGYGLNIMGEAGTVKVRGSKNINIFRARSRATGEARATLSQARRHFCRKCGSALWVADPRWPEWVYPFASAMDTPLPKPPEAVDIMLDFAAPWVDLPRGKSHIHYPEYPEEAIVDWHRRGGLETP